MAITTLPAESIRYLMDDLSLGSILPDGAWPIFVSEEPDTPDNVITLYDTAGITDGQHHNGGEVQEHPGLLIRVRSSSYLVGSAKADAIAKALVGNSAYRAVISETGVTVHCLTRTSGVISLGADESNKGRFLFTVNFVVSLI